MGQKTMRDRLAPGRGPSFPHPGFFGAVQIMLIIFHIAYYPKTTVDTLIEDLFLYNMILWDLCVSANPSYPKCPALLEGPSCPWLP